MPLIFIISFIININGIVNFKITKQKRPTYSVEFKLEAAQLVVDGEHTVYETTALMSVSKSAINKSGNCLIAR